MRGGAAGGRAPAGMVGALVGRDQHEAAGLERGGGLAGAALGDALAVEKVVRELSAEGDERRRAVGEVAIGEQADGDDAHGGAVVVEGLLALGAELCRGAFGGGAGLGELVRGGVELIAGCVSADLQGVAHVGGGVLADGEEIEVGVGAHLGAACGWGEEG